MITVIIELSTTKVHDSKRKSTGDRMYGVENSTAEKITSATHGFPNPPNLRLSGFDLEH